MTEDQLRVLRILNNFGALTWIERCEGDSLPSTVDGAFYSEDFAFTTNRPDLEWLALRNARATARLVIGHWDVEQGLALRETMPSLIQLGFVTDKYCMISIFEPQVNIKPFATVYKLTASGLQYAATQYSIYLLEQLKAVLIRPAGDSQ